MGKEMMERGILQSVWRRLVVLGLIILLLFPPVVEAALKEGITYSVTAVVGGFDVTITLPKDWCNFKFIICEDAQGEFYLKLGTERFPSSGTVNIKPGQSGTIRVTKEGNYTLMEADWPQSDVNLGTLEVKDNTKPTSTITSPSAGSWQRGNFSVSATDSDKGSGLDKCEYKVVSSGTTTKDWTSRTCSTSITITVGSSKDCRHEGSNKCTVYARAKDKAGNVGDSAVRSFSPDWTAPAAPSVSSSSHPDQTKWYSNNDPTFSWTAPSDTSGIAGYSYILDQTSTTTPDTTLEPAGTSKSYTDKADGTWYFHIRAKDNAGNWGSTAHYTVKIDTVAPSVSVSGAPANWQNTDATASVSCSDDSSGCNSSTYKLKVYSSNPGSCPTSYSSYDLSSPQTISSHKWVCAAAKDNAGNAGFSSPAEFKVEKIAPTYESYSVSGCDYQDTTNKICWAKAGTTAQHEIRHYDGTSTPRTQYLTFTKDGCTPNACASGEEIKSYVNVDTGAFTDWMANNNYIDITGAICVETSGCTGTYAKERWTVTTGSSGGDFKVWTFLYDEAGNGRGYDYVGWWYKVDVTSPSSAITSPAAGSTQTSDFPVSVSDSDGGSGLDTTKCEYRVVSSGTETKPWTTRTCSSSFTVTVGTGKDCRHDGTNTCTVYVRAWDKVGNVGTGSRSFSITTALPDLAISEADITFEKAGGG